MYPLVYCMTREKRTGTTDGLDPIAFHRCYFFRDLNRPFAAESGCKSQPTSVLDLSMISVIGILEVGE